MTAYDIQMPRGDQCFRVEYDPETHSLDDVAALGIAGQVASFDPYGLTVIVPVGTLGFKHIPLRDYLLNRAEEMHGGERIDPQAEWGTWNKTMTGVK
jgi:hypothetical protein